MKKNGWEEGIMRDWPRVEHCEGLRRDNLVYRVWHQEQYGLGKVGI